MELEHVNWKDFSKLDYTALVRLAVSNNGLAVQYAHMKHVLRSTWISISFAAINENPFAIEYIEDQSEELCLCAVNLNGTALYGVRNQNLSICKLAVENNANAFYHMDQEFVNPIRDMLDM
jgi:hypothetical protein